VSSSKNSARFASKGISFFRHAIGHHAGQGFDHGAAILHLGYLSTALEVHRGVHGNVYADAVLHFRRTLPPLNHVAEGLWR
jgi:hypothetical protein